MHAEEDSQRHRGLRKPLLLTAALALALLAPTGRAQKSQTPTWVESAAERKAEFEALKQRAESLASEMSAVSLGRVRNDPRRGWDRLLADFDQWAHKFNVPTQDKTLPTTVAGPGGAPIHRNYPLVAEGPPGVAGYFCLKDFSRSTAAQFLYECYRE